MLGIIVLENGVDAGTLEVCVKAIEQAGINEIIAVSENGTAVVRSVKSLNEALKAATSDTLVFLDARLASEQQQLTAQLQSLQIGLEADAVYAPLNIAGEEIELPDLSVDNLVNAIDQAAGWPTALFAVRHNLLESIAVLDINNLSSAAILIAIAAQHERIAKLNSINLGKFEMGLISNEEKAGLLALAINSCNIEELFPEHNWQTHTEESAAASYHTLAALFIRLGDIKSAMECLTFSDQLEDSPRSLALKALISLNKGETLGAVANMISSLQQYEVRKRNDNNQHYLTFIPTDLEIVNSSLNRGLNALNKKDNQTALQQFAKAVFNFDSFYGENGLDDLVQ